MALINCYRYEQAHGSWNRSGGVYKIRAGGVPGGQPLGFNSFKLQRLLITISTEFAKLQAQFHGHIDEAALGAAVRTAITDAGLAPANAPGSIVFPTDDLGPGASYTLKLLVIDRDVSTTQALGVAATRDAKSNPMCVSCGLTKDRPKMDKQVKSHSVIPASFWVAIVPSALAAIGVEKIAFTGDDEVLRNALVNAGNEAAGTYAKPGADPQAFSMCSDCESRQADFSLLQRFDKGERWMRYRENHAKEAEVRTFIGTQFLPGPHGIGQRDEMVRITYNVARRVASAFERQIFSSLDGWIRRLPATPPSTPAPTVATTPVKITTGRFGSPAEQQSAMGGKVFPQLMKAVSDRSISTWVGITSLEARRWSAQQSVKSRHYVDHLSLRAGLQVWWSGMKLDDGTPLKAKLEQIGKLHGARRAKQSWKGLPGEPPLVVYLAQNIDAFLQAVVEMSVLFAGLSRHDQTKDEKSGVVKV